MKRTAPGRESDGVAPDSDGVAPESEGVAPEPGTLDELFSLAYEELRRRAASMAPGARGTTLSPTSLVHETWLKLAGSERLSLASPLHFRRVASRAMRQVLVDAARRRVAVKRGGGAVRITFDESVDGSASSHVSPEEFLALDAALEELARFAPRQARLVESRFFGGMEFAEIARLLGVSESTVMRDWRAARAWLAAHLRDPGPAGGPAGDGADGAADVERGG